MDQTRIDQAKRELNELTGPYGDGNVDAVKKILDEFPFLINEVSGFFFFLVIFLSLHHSCFSTQRIFDFPGFTVLTAASFYHHVRIVEYLVSRPDLDVNLGVSFHSNDL